MGYNAKASFGICRERACVLYAFSNVLSNTKHAAAMARQTCRDCGDVLNDQNRTMKSVSKKGKQYYLSRCRPCLAESDTLLRMLKKQHPMPPPGSPCECCGRIDKLFCDHSHSTGKFRAWICRNCNSGIGLLGDSEAGLRQALAYLERVRTSSPINHRVGNK